ncbi:MAG: hypothetical protein AB1432_05575 [Bacteroidota bacterium]
MPRLKTDKEHTEFVWTRVDAVVNLILENDRYMQSKRNPELTKTVMDKFNLASRTAHRYISEAKKEIRKLGQSNKKKAFERAIRDREYLFQKSKNGIKDEQNLYVTKPDLKLALEVVKDRDKLNGLYVDQIEHSGTIDLTSFNISSLTDDQLQKLKDMLKNKIPLKDALLHIGVIIK